MGWWAPTIILHLWAAHLYINIIYSYHYNSICLLYYHYHHVNNVVQCYRTNDEGNVMDAACKGAQFGLKIIGAIVANIVAFVSFVAFINAIISWLGHLVGLEDLSFEVRKKKLQLYYCLYYYLNELRFILLIDRLSVRSTCWARH